MNANVSGNLVEAARTSGFITDATKSLQPTTVPESMVTNNGKMTCEQRDSLYGHRGGRVGEALHPSPSSRRRRR